MSRVAWGGGRGVGRDVRSRPRERRWSGSVVDRSQTTGIVHLRWRIAAGAIQWGGDWCALGWYARDRERLQASHPVFTASRPSAACAGKTPRFLEQSRLAAFRRERPEHGRCSFRGGGLQRKRAGVGAVDDNEAGVDHVPFDEAIDRGNEGGNGVAGAPLPASGVEHLLRLLGGEGAASPPRRISPTERHPAARVTMSGSRTIVLAASTCGAARRSSQPSTRCCSGMSLMNSEGRAGPWRKAQ